MATMLDSENLALTVRNTITFFYYKQRTSDVTLMKKTSKESADEVFHKPNSQILTSIKWQATLISNMYVTTQV